MRWLIGAGLLVPVAASAHGPGELFLDWVAWALLLALVGYLAGLLRAGRRPALWRVALYVTGWSLLAISLVGPVEHWAHASLAGHMVQHMMLLAAAPPLILLARPMPQYMMALPPAARRRAGPILGGLYGTTASAPVTAFIVHGLVIWLWHLPLPYQLALEHRLIHDLEHLAFFATGMWFWWTLVAPGRLGTGGFGLAAVLAVLTMMHTGMLGALMTFAPQLLYPDHPAGFAGLDKLSDQQLAGLLMWVPGGLIYTVAALILAGFWLQRISAANTCADRI
ncbi:cytochrome c oxidase assembly protein [Wenzhouxiangella sp. AB-CW3]|uniref:cytochrome c oxidase assembly protein n=1 Tax=Wenzhouxiangella sp. AB-CW3 TaxID=2771012 RepID=UPI00168B8F91|nr:cytochrome c oxidase assembly protein [Wenzhouxiangella sp. AB-CW3]QOC21692.1 cytochrome c oxidase assembly protein [Wenzhouxiangella sp. AB-CW3]